MRGWLCRKSFSRLLQDAPQAHGLKRTWAAGQLSTVRQALTGLVQDAADDLDQLFAELDASLAVSRGMADPLQLREQAAAAAAAAVSRNSEAAGGAAVARQAAAGGVEPQLQQQTQQQQSGRRSSKRTLAISRSSNSSRHAQPAAAVNRQHRAGSQQHHTAQQQPRRVAPATAAGAAAIERANRAQQAHAAVAAQAAAPASSAHHAGAASEAVAVDWEQVISTACQRAETECAICLAPLTAQRETQGVALLSCSHILHVSCVSSFENFQQGRGCEPSCPVCRAAYTRRCFDVHDAQQV